VVCAVVAVPTANKRLIRLGEDITPVWMSNEEIDFLASKKLFGFIDVTDDVVAKKLAFVNAIPTSPSFPAEVNNMISRINADNWWNYVLELEAFGTRHRNTQQGINAASWILNEMRALGANTNLTVEYELFNHNSIPQPSTITRIIGCDSSVVNEIVIIGGHEDSTSTDINNAPGADDDATGTATVMEMFRLFAQTNFCPRRTIEFHTYAGEEGGLIGSNNIAQAYNAEGINVISMVQFDMTSYLNGGTNPIALIQDYTNAQLNNFLSELLDAYVPDLPYVTNSRCGYGCSDHASWTSRGYPAAFPFEAPFGDHNPLIHTARDVNTGISEEKGARVLKLATAYLVEMALF